jgi:hypothetical protein
MRSISISGLATRAAMEPANTAIAIIVFTNQVPL